MTPPVLVFAGVDPSGGAGIAADVLAIAAQGGHAMPVVTALTVQDNDRVFGVLPVDAGTVRRQALALIDKIAVGAVKIGIPGNAANAQAIAEVIALLRARQPGLPVVLDPVLASGNGDALSREDAVKALAPLLPLATLIVPNLPEAALLGGVAGVAEQAAVLRGRGCRHVLVTGGHADGALVYNSWFGPDGRRDWQFERLDGAFHGSGCTLASAIAARLARGQAMAAALADAQGYCQRALAAAYPIAPGQWMPQRLCLT
ncbi:bifunctional hydroxymethylpyrimidine kinase/phosphomethylpyrimidine kinase [Janthinobacterium fluminis]|uniref:hydroxymethylpyrimidine kinase n=1 Tax=Janthinobacterium fluminis TaxID=2987524 RepID=A0ABT5K4A5_9BURK|nr:hydroxymethylpyrimidine/phosphomethylpyrimidine kinase [Janthinobacterium fluminis]MDC8759734.1 hydroxymethylpyrimidine/phosphomethylpyrimidine kinase [Janthinobacterium fluminis]